MGWCAFPPEEVHQRSLAYRTCSTSRVGSSTGVSGAAPAAAREPGPHCVAAAALPHQLLEASGVSMAVRKETQNVVLSLYLLLIMAFCFTCEKGSTLSRYQNNPPPTGQGFYTAYSRCWSSQASSDHYRGTRNSPSLCSSAGRRFLLLTHILCGPLQSWTSRSRRSTDRSWVGG